MDSIVSPSIHSSSSAPDSQGAPQSGTDHDSWGKQARAVRLTLALDAVTIIPVVAVAILSGSMLLYSDIVDYAKSVLASLVAWNIIRRIRKGKAVEYDYGPGKLESIGKVFGSLVFIAGLVFMAGFAFQRILHPVELNAEFTALGAGFQLVGFALNFWLWRRNRALAERTHSQLMDVQWRIARADALSNLVVLVALTLTLVLRHLDWEVYIDPVCALAYIFYATGTFIPPLTAGIQDLVDRTLGEDLQLKIVRRLTENYDRFDALHGVRSRRVGDRIFVEIALGFNPDKRVGEAVDTIERLRKAVEQDIPHSDVSIVMKPP
jgi:ferrous-iron efflux pump FieF